MSKGRPSWCPRRQPALWVLRSSIAGGYWYANVRGEFTMVCTSKHEERLKSSAAPPDLAADKFGRTLKRTLPR